MEWLRRRRVSLPRVLMVVLYGLLALQTASLLIVVLNTAREQTAAVHQAMRNANAQILTYMDSVLKDVAAYDSYYLTDSRFLSILNAESMQSGTGAYAQAQVYVKSLLRRHIVLAPSIVGITVYTSVGQIYDSTGSDESYLSALAAIREDMRAQNLNTSVTAPKPLSIHRRTHWCVTLTNRLADLYTRRTLGFIHYDVGLQDLLDNFLHRDQDMGYTLQTYLFSGESLVYSNGEFPLPSTQWTSERDLKRLLTQQDEEVSFRFRADSGETYLLLSTYSPRYGIRLVQCEEYSSLATSIRDAVLLIVLLGGCMLAIWGIAISVLGLMVRKDTARTKAFILGAALDTPLPQEPMFFEEMEDLLRAYRGVSEGLHAAQEREKQILRQKQEMELRYLEAQINPHFICNSLNLISSLALLENNLNINEMAANLAHLLYFNLKGERIVTVREEMEQVERYIAIQSMRFPERFIVSVDLPEELLGCRICRFALQPVVENAMSHGMERSKSRVHLWIAGHVEGERCRIVVENDGVAPGSARIAEINHRLIRGEDEVSFEPGRDSGIGLMNVHVRLRREYGEEGWVRLEERPDGRGLRVIIGFLRDERGGRSSVHPDR